MIAAEFYDLCAAHDWTYNFSDDHRVWKRGEAERKRLVSLMQDHHEFQGIFYAWQNYMFRDRGEPIERPERPEVTTFPGSVPNINEGQMTLC